MSSPNAYVYKITNTVTNEFYIGYRYKNQRQNVLPENDLFVTYFSSSKRVLSDIEKYGKSNFIYEIIFQDQNSLLCWEKEQETIKELWGNSLLLNSKYNDVSSKTEHYRRVGIVSEEARKKMSVAGRGKTKSLEHRRKIAESNRGRVKSLEERQKISNSRIGKPTNKGKSPPKFSCPHCNKVASWANLQKWHNDKCKFYVVTSSISEKPSS